MSDHNDLMHRGVTRLRASMLKAQQDRVSDAMTAGLVWARDSATWSNLQAVAALKLSGDRDTDGKALERAMGIADVPPEAGMPVWMNAFRSLDPSAQEVASFIDGARYVHEKV